MAFGIGSIDIWRTGSRPALMRSVLITYTRVSTASGNPGNPGNLLEFENPPGNPGNLLEFNIPPGNFFCKMIDRIGFRS